MYDAANMGSVKRRGGMGGSVMDGGQRRMAALSCDPAFRMVMASAEDTRPVSGFINDMLGLEVSEVTIENPFDIRACFDEHGSPRLTHTEVDVLARLGDGSLVTVEMQVAYQSHYLSRALYLAASRFVKGYGDMRLALSSGGDAKYSALRPVYGISVMSSKAFNDPYAIRSYKLYDEEHGMGYGDGFKRKGAGGLLTLAFWELCKELDGSRPNMLEWSRLFSGREPGGGAPAYIRQAAERLAFESLSKKEREVISYAEILEQDRIQREADIRQDIADSYEQGMERGAIANALETARRLLQEGLPSELVERATGITSEQLASLRS
jgi:predicted transposase/invertase (TIGR01784 family)